MSHVFVLELAQGLFAFKKVPGMPEQAGLKRRWLGLFLSPGGRTSRGQPV